MQPITAKNAIRTVSVTLLLAFSPFHEGCKPPRTSVLDEGKNMGPKPPVVTKAPVEEADARTPKERLDAGDTKVVPVKPEDARLPGKVELPSKPVRILPKSL